MQQRDSLLTPGIRRKMKCQRTKRNETKRETEERKKEKKTGESTDWNDG